MTGDAVIIKILGTRSTKIRSWNVLQSVRTTRKNSGRSRMKTGVIVKKWDQYEDAVNEMLKKTSTTFAPWHILESVDKKICPNQGIKNHY